MSERQDTFINWLLSLCALYLMVPFGKNALDWLTGDDLVDLTRLTLSVILLFYGLWVFLLIFNRIKE